MDVIKLGTAGLIIGGATGAVTDAVFNMVKRSMGDIGMPIQVLVGGVAASAFMFGGDRVLNSLFDMSADPMGGMLFYQACFFSQTTARGVAGTTAGYVAKMVQQARPEPVIMGTGVAKDTTKLAQADVHMDKMPATQFSPEPMMGMSIGPKNSNKPCGTGKCGDIHL